MSNAEPANFNIANFTKRNVPDIPFVTVKEKILGKKHVVNLIFVTPAECRKLNATYRKKDYATNVLSFPIDKNLGEIYINLQKAAAEGADFDHSPADHLLFLFIHGLLHLKGLTHGGIMSREEKKFFDFFLTKHGAQHNNRARHRNVVDQTRGLRTKKRR